MKTVASGHTTTHRLRKAVHHNKLASKRGVLERMFTLWFRGFVYNQIWEDPRVDAAALRLGPESSILTISSGGCNVLNYLVHEPKRIVAIDLNANHMALTRLKLAALEHLPDYEAFYNFFGYGRHADNIRNYNRYLRDALDPRPASSGSRPTGRAGRWARGGSATSRPASTRRRSSGSFSASCTGSPGAWGSDPARLLAARSIDEQRRIFDGEFGPLFENRLVRWMGRQPVAVYSLGIPPSQHAVMLEEQQGDGAKLFDMYRERIRRLACGFPLDDNYFAWQAFGRRYDHEGRKALPDYLKRENYETIKRMVGRVETHVASLADQIRREKPGSLNCFVLLDSQDWMPPPVIDELWTEIARVGGRDTRVIFRTAGELSPIEKSLSPATMARFRADASRARDLHLQDRSAIYGMFHLYELTDPATS